MFMSGRERRDAVRIFLEINAVDMRIVVDEVDMILVICRDPCGGEFPAVASQLNVADVRTGLFVECAQIAVAVEHDIVLCHDDGAFPRRALLRTARDILVALERVEYFAVRGVCVERFGPLLVRAALRVKGGDVEAVRIRPDQECVCLVRRVFRTGELVKYVLGENRFCILYAILGCCAEHNVGIRHETPARVGVLASVYGTDDTDARRGGQRRLT